jgi:hypothetical protein
MSGLLPALPLVVIRPFLPESPAWVAKKQAGTLKRPSVRELFSPDLARTTIVTTVMFACSYGAAFGAIQMIPQIVPGLADVKAAGRSHTVPQQRQHEQKVAAEYTKLQEIGGGLDCRPAALLFLSQGGKPDVHGPESERGLPWRNPGYNHVAWVVRRGAGDSCPVQFLGQLLAAGVSDPSPRHR